MSSLLSIVLDPKFFNYLIMFLYLCNAIRWGVHGSLGDVSYWLSAAAITASVTWGYSR
jgi:hypothetical protein